MPTPKLAFAAKRTVMPQLIDEIEGQKIEEALHQHLTERAYSLYEASGRQGGNDEKNWTRAKSESLQSLEKRESGTWVALTASMPDPSPASIRIYVNTHRVILKVDKAASGSSAESPGQQTSIFLAADLDVEVDPATATAAFKDRTLNLMVKKRSSASAAGGRGY